MVKFHGDLLLGGAALRNLDGMMTTDDSSETNQWRGHFHLDRCNQSLLELHRPYLLMLSDGRSRRIVVTCWQESAEQDAIEVQFQAPR